jgi:hypothetical protein
MIGSGTFLTPSNEVTLGTFWLNLSNGAMSRLLAPYTGAPEDLGKAGRRYKLVLPQIVYRTSRTSVAAD